jgi:hypothetical protein
MFSRHYLRPWEAAEHLRDKGVPSPQYLRRWKAAQYLRDKGVPCTAKYLAKLACVGGGPRYYLFGRIPLYTPEWLDEYIAAKLGDPVRSTSEYMRASHRTQKPGPRRSHRPTLSSVATSETQRRNTLSADRQKASLIADCGSGKEARHER